MGAFRGQEDQAVGAEAGLPRRVATRSANAAVRDARWLLTSASVHGVVQYHWTFTGSNTGHGGTGKWVRISGFEEWTFGEDGLVAESQGHYHKAE